MKLMSSPLLHLSVVPSMFNSTLFGSAMQHTPYNPVLLLKPVVPLFTGNLLNDYFDRSFTTSTAQCTFTYTYQNSNQQVAQSLVQMSPEKKTTTVKKSSHHCRVSGCIFLFRQFDRPLKKKKCILPSSKGHSCLGF